MTVGVAKQARGTLGLHSAYLILGFPLRVIARSFAISKVPPKIKCFLVQCSSDGLNFSEGLRGFLPLQFFLAPAGIVTDNTDIGRLGLRCLRIPLFVYVCFLNANVIDSSLAIKQYSIVYVGQWYFSDHRN